MLTARVRPMDKGNLLAFADVVIDDEYVIHDITIKEGKNSRFVSMPASKNKKGEWNDIFHPITKEARQELIDVVEKEYEKALKALEEEQWTVK